MTDEQLVLDGVIPPPRDPQFLLEAGPMCRSCEGRLFDPGETLP